MAAQETLPHAQAVRRVYENETSACAPAKSDIFHVACYPDVSTGKDVILWDDILAAFKNVVHVRSGTMILPFLKGPDFKNLEPLRIAAIPRATLDVVVSDQLVRTVAASASKHLAVVSKDFTQTIINAGLGDKDAQVALGDMCKDGKGVLKDYQAAMDWYFRAAGQSVLLNFSTALVWYLKAADLGDARAQCNVAMTYRNGQDVSVDYAEAMEWFHMAAGQGNPNAQTHIGIMYNSGRGVPRHCSQSSAWFRKAAEQGDKHGQVNIGGCYRDGQGVTQDYVKAMEWLLKSTDQGQGCGVGVV